MKAPLNERGLYGLMVVLAVWPLIHIGLVEAFDVNPWKLAGWGMYSAPQLSPWVDVATRAPGAGLWEPVRRLSPELRDELNSFLRVRRGLRRLVAPNRLGRVLLEHYPTIEEVRITVHQPVLDRATGMIVAGSVDHAYRR